MRDAECVEFLQWGLPRLGLLWPGYRKVRRTVCKRLGRRLAELGLADARGYRRLLAETPAEWARLDAMCRIPISRFYRDRAVFDVLAREVLPAAAEAALARGARKVRCWSAGGASGEEAYTLAIIWRFAVAPAFPALALKVLATDVDETMVRRASTGCYGFGSLKELPAAWRARAFVPAGRVRCIRPEFREGVELCWADIRKEMPEAAYDLILCRNLVFTYFAPDLQRDLLGRMLARLVPGGFLVIGSHETLPAGAQGLAPIGSGGPIYRSAAA